MDLFDKMTCDLAKTTFDIAKTIFDLVDQMTFD